MACKFGLFFHSISMEYLFIYLYPSSFFINSFQCTGPLPPLLNLSLVILFFFCCKVNVIVFLISLSESLLLGYWNVTYFCILFLCPETLLTISFFLWSLNFLYIICHLHIKTVLFLPFQFGCLFFLFPCLVPDLGEAISFSLLSMLIVGRFSILGLLEKWSLGFQFAWCIFVLSFQNSIFRMLYNVQ